MVARRKIATPQRNSTTQIIIIGSVTCANDANLQKIVSSCCRPIRSCRSTDWMHACVDGGSGDGGAEVKGGGRDDIRFTVVSTKLNRFMDWCKNLSSITITKTPTTTSSTIITTTTKTTNECQSNFFNVINFSVTNRLRHSCSSWKRRQQHEQHVVTHKNSEM